MYSFFPGEEAITQVKGIAQKMLPKLTLGMTGADLLRMGLTSFIDNCSKSSFPCHGDDEILELWHSILGKMFQYNFRLSS